MKFPLVVLVSANSFDTGCLLGFFFSFVSAKLTVLTGFGMMKSKTLG